MCVNPCFLIYHQQLGIAIEDEMDTASDENMDEYLRFTVFLTLTRMMTSFYAMHITCFP